MDPKTVMAVEDIGKLPSPRIELLANRYEENPWVDYNRIKLFSKIPFLKSFGKMRLPFFAVFIFENPQLVKALVGLFILLASLLVLFAIQH
jgi:hypothetical protein